MYDQPIVFTADYPDELVQRAARAFRDYQFKRYGLLLIAAFIVNAVGLILALRYGAAAGVALAFLSFVVVLGPTWFLYRYFTSPSKYTASLRRVFPPSVRVSLKAASVTFEVQGQEREVPWSLVKAVVESSNFFLLVFSPFAFTLLPRQGMPAEAEESLHARARQRAA
jgi:uncharacterized iron-regulated membrane protein